jgi:hypothetical protein
MKNSKEFCLINVCSYFVIVLKTYFLIQLWGGVGGGYSMAGGLDDLWQEAALPKSDYIVRNLPPCHRAMPATQGGRGRLGRCNFTFP